MERTRVLIKWKNVTGSLRIGNRIIKPGQVFTATEDEIPQIFRDTVIPLETLPSAKEPEKTPLAYEIVKKNNKFFVVSGAGKTLNEEPLTKAQAEELLQSLE